MWRPTTCVRPCVNVQGFSRKLLPESCAELDEFMAGLGLNRG